jgi:pimeloyl-ACP methyl ester carboxylesterase
MMVGPIANTLSRPTFSVVETTRGPFWVGQRGAGADVLLISGVGDTHEIWDDVTPTLSDGFRVTCFDNRGVGRTLLGSRGLTVAGFAQDALAVMRAVGIQRAHVIGSSMGGAVAQELALAEPESVVSLILAGTWARPDEYLSRVLRHMARLQIVLQDRAELMEATCLWVYGSKAHADGTVERLIEAMKASTSPPQPQALFARTAEAAILHDTADRLGAIAAPTLVLVGSEDRICPPRLSRELNHLIVGSSLQMMEGRGHQPFQEDPDAFTSTVCEFWSGI